MRNRHVEVKGAKLRFRFRGKSGQEHDIETEDRRVARIVKKLAGIARAGSFPISRRGWRSAAGSLPKT